MSGTAALADGVSTARTLLAQRRLEAARQVLAELEPRLSEPSACAAVGDLYVVLRDYDRALACYDRAVRLEPAHPRHWFNRAAVRRYLGQLELAEADYDQLIALDPQDAEAYLNRAQLRTQTHARNHIEELSRYAARGFATWQAEVAIRFALAKEYEDIGEYAQSWHSLALGARLRRQHLRYEVSTDVVTADWIMQAFPLETGAPAGGCDCEQPIFIVGLPRTGSTLIERILASHSQVCAAGELHDFGICVIEAVRRRLGRTNVARRDMVAASAGVDFAALGSSYVERTRPWSGGAARFTDKLPLNYLYCGLIARALPRARIVHVTRHPLATCYAIFKTLFNQGYPFSYDLDELAAYYGAYHRLMQHWRRTLPDRIHEVAYEQLIADPEAESRRLLAAAGLPWEPACLLFHENRAPVATASAAQVRRPLYRTALDQWRHYERELAPLRARLLEAGVPVEP